MDNTTWAAVCLAGALSLAGAAQAGPKDKWISTKATLALLAMDGLSIKSVNVDTRDGNVVLHGRVGSEAAKGRAEATVRAVGGVKTLQNLLQVVTPDEKDQVKFEDSVTHD
jgi:osmotically-inducible protein OsmY